MSWLCIELFRSNDQDIQREISVIPRRADILETKKQLAMPLKVAFALLCATAVARAATSWIVPGAEWTSTSGTKIDAHGGMVLKEGNTFYWVGQAASHSNQRYTPMMKMSELTRVDEQPYMYTSTDLLDWTPARNPKNSIQYMWRPKLAKPDESWRVRFLPRTIFTTA